MAKKEDKLNQIIVLIEDVKKDIRLIIAKYALKEVKSDLRESNRKIEEHLKVPHAV